MVTRRQFGLGLTAAALSPALPVPRARAAGNVVRIGMIQPMSGPYSAYAQEGQPAFDYIISKINASGGVRSMGGAKIEIVLADDASQPARTATEARRLASEENCAMLVGSMLSGQMMAVSPVLDELQVPTLSIWAGGSRSNYFYSLGFPYDRGYAQSMYDMVEWLRDKQGFALKTVVPAYSNYEAGQQSQSFPGRETEGGRLRGDRRGAARRQGAGPDPRHDPHPLDEAGPRHGPGHAARRAAAASGPLQPLLSRQPVRGRHRRLFRPVAVARSRRGDRQGGADEKPVRHDRIFAGRENGLHAGDRRGIARGQDHQERGTGRDPGGAGGPRAPAHTGGRRLGRTAGAAGGAGQGDHSSRRPRALSRQAQGTGLRTRPHAHRRLGHVHPVEARPDAGSGVPHRIRADRAASCAARTTACPSSPSRG